MRLKLMLLSIAVVFGLFSCQKNDEQNFQMDKSVSSHKVIIEEVIQANSYTYLNVKEGTENYWMAVTKMEAKKGETYYYSGGLEMKNFESKDLQRTFDKIYFVQDISNQPLASGHKMGIGSPHGRKLPAQKNDISVDPIKGGITIAELYANRDSYKEKTIKIKGQVTKYNPNIMGKNWVHIQDGTNDSGNYDLTITTKDVANVGDVVIFEGKITLNKDFSAGYFYEVIMENAKKLNQQKFL